MYRYSQEHISEGGTNYANQHLIYAITRLVSLTKDQSQKVVFLIEE